MPQALRIARRWLAAAAATLIAAVLPVTALGEEGEKPTTARPSFEIGFEGKLHYRHSDDVRLPVNFPFSPDQLPPGASQGFLETVDPGDHLELSVLTVRLDAVWGPSLAAHAKIDFIDLHDRNPTSTDKEYDVDELWVRFGRETGPALLPDRPGAYLKLGKFPKLERQDDRHLESYGLVTTAVSRFEDVGVELGADLGRHLYVKASLTQGNPVFLRDPNALAGDNGIDALRQPNPDPALGSGITIPYDADTEELDTDGDLEVGAGLGLRFADAAGRNGFEALLWGYERTLAETVELDGTFYGGDLDLLRGPLNLFPFALEGDEKREYGTSVWLYLGGFSLFAEAMEQELGGLERSGFEVEAAWSFSLPLRFAVAQRQLFPAVAPAVRYSRLDPDFAAPPVTPSPSFAWEWEKIDAGVRLVVVDGVDLTVEWAGNEFVLASGATVDNDELLTTLRFRMGGAAP